jgi:hypothetical protein
MNGMTHEFAMAQQHDVQRSNEMPRLLNEQPDAQLPQLLNEQNDV